MNCCLFVVRGKSACLLPGRSSTIHHSVLSASRVLKIASTSDRRQASVHSPDRRRLEGMPSSPNLLPRAGRVQPLPKFHSPATTSMPGTHHCADEFLECCCSDVFAGFVGDDCVCCVGCG